MKYAEMTQGELLAEKELCQKQYEEFKAKGLKLNMARGKPSEEQEKLSLPLMDIISMDTNFVTSDGVDTLNYGNLQGLKGTREAFSEMLGVPPENIIVGGNSSLTLMFDYLTQCCLKGVSAEATPWSKQGNLKFLCPVPGYDRHFFILDYLGFEMIPIPMDENGPDMDLVEELVKDHSVKGICCVPKYANPTGITYSDEVVERLAQMEAAPDFRIIWDNAYCIHDLTGRHDDLKDIFTACVEAGHMDRPIAFTSTSKISFPGAGVACLASSRHNCEWILKRRGIQTVGPDKLNQIRHTRYFHNREILDDHMAKMAAIITPKFELILKMFKEELGPCDIASWTDPNGGYFISLDCMEGTAKRVFKLCKEAGVTLTQVGATFPYGKDPKNSNIRIAPTYPPLDELEQACKLLIICVKLAALEKLLEE